MLDINQETATRSLTKGMFLIFIFLLSTSVHAGGKTMSEQLYVLPQDCDFIAGDARACAPQLTPRYSNPFRGVLINGPKTVVWPKNDSPDNYTRGPFGGRDGPFQLVVVVLYQLPYLTLGLDGDFRHEITVVVVNQQTDEVYSGRQQRIGFKGPQPRDFYSEADKKIDKELEKSRISGSYFKFNLADALRLPIINATYTVYATLGEYKSNVLTIKTIVK
jgi:hypothetical protein